MFSKYGKGRIGRHFVGRWPLAEYPNEEQGCILGCVFLDGFVNEFCNLIRIFFF